MPDLDVLLAEFKRLERRFDRLDAELASLKSRYDQAPWQTRQELAAQLGCHVDTVDRRAAARDGVELRRIGRAVRVRLIAMATDAEVARAAAGALA